MESYTIPEEIISDILKERKRRSKREEILEESLWADVQSDSEELGEFKLISKKFVDKFTLKLSKLKASDFKFRKEEVKKNLDVYDIVTKTTIFWNTDFSHKVFYAKNIIIDFVDLGLINLKRQQKWDLIRRILIPLFLEKEKHWILINLDLYSFEIQIYDSFVSTDIKYTDIHKMINRIAARSQIIDQIKKELIMEKVLDKNWLKKDLKFKLKVVDWPKQMNKYDWGVYACMFMYLLYQLIPISVKIEQVKKRRRSILWHACENNITDMDELFEE